MNLDRDNLQLRTELASLKAVYKQERDRSAALENRVRIHESSIDVLNNTVAKRERQIQELTHKLNEQEQMLTQKEHEKEKQKKKFNSKLAVESDKNKREFDMKLREQRAKMQERMRIKDEKLRLVSNILQSEDVPSLPRSQSSEDILSDKERGGGAFTARTESSAQPTTRTDIYCTPRHVSNKSQLSLYSIYTNPRIYPSCLLGPGSCQQSTSAISFRRRQMAGASCCQSCATGHHHAAVSEESQVCDQIDRYEGAHGTWNHQILSGLTGG